MLNRRSAPPVQTVSRLTLPQPQVLRLDNGISLYALDFPGHEVLKVEVVFRAGRPQEEKRLAARTTAKLLREGTQRLKGSEIAEQFDFYGASLSVPTNLDTANFILYSLHKYAAEVLPLFAEVIQEPVFPEDEIETFRRTSIQELAVELDKVETVAYRKVTELIFGENHPYGYNSVMEDYAAIQRADLQHFFNKWYRPDNCLLFASGRVDGQVLEALNRYFGAKITDGALSPFPPPPVSPFSRPARINISHPGSLQTAIKIGRRTFGRKHPDFNGLFVLNTILGGYFGSRLMANIREKKGYTYNIYSTLDAYLNDGCLYIGTEVDTANTEKTIKAIFSEMKKLRETLVPESELSMVRNYLLGMLLNGLDGPMNISDLVRSLVVEELSWETFNQMVDTIRDIDPATIQALAQRYLDPQDYWTVTVG